MPSALHKIRHRAHQLKKKHPRTAWKELIKKASKEYNRGKLGATKLIERGETKRSKPKHTFRIHRSSKGRFKGMTRIAGITGGCAGNGPITKVKAKAIYKETVLGGLGSLLMKKEKATTKRAKRKIGKMITEHRRELRRLQ